MPKMISDFPLTVGFRLSERELAKLNALVTQTGRPRAELLRRLIHLAEATDLPELRFISGPRPPVEAEAEEVVHAG
jgi:hypothetical protein